MFREAVTGARKKLGLSDARTQALINNQADFHNKQGKPQLAEPLLHELAVFLRDQAGPDSPVYASQLERLWQNLLDQKKYVEAEAVARDCLAIRAKKEPDVWTTFDTRARLGAALLGQEKYADAEPLLLQGYEGMKAREAKIPKNAKIRLIQALERLVELYDTWGKEAEAARWRQELADEKARPK